jgi:thioredoxin-related protein
MYRSFFIFIVIFLVGFGLFYVINKNDKEFENNIVLSQEELDIKSGYENGKKTFDKKCLSCHIKHIPIDIIKNNFAHNNEPLNLKYPSVNMLAFALTRGPKHIGNIEDKEMQAIEIEEFIKEYLSNPDRTDSICAPSVLHYYIDKEKVDYNLKDIDYQQISLYLTYYNKMREASQGNIIKKHLKSGDFKDILNEASKIDKMIIIEATSKSCHYCIKMSREVLSLKSVQDTISKDYIFVEVDIDDMELPFGLNKNYKGVTPTFFFLDKSGVLLNKYPGSWNKRDFLNLLKENKVIND